AARLAADGHQVSALARDTARASRRLPQARWVKADIARLARPEEWMPLLGGIDAVVNAAGALQDGTRDDVEALQQVAMQALFRAAKTSGKGLIVQISARTDGTASATPFLSTKRNADTALQASGVPFVIL